MISMQNLQLLVNHMGGLAEAYDGLSEPLSLLPGVYLVNVAPGSLLS